VFKFAKGYASTYPNETVANFNILIEFLR